MLRITVAVPGVAAIPPSSLGFAYACADICAKELGKSQSLR